MTTSSRTPAAIRQHYEIEKQLAATLRNSSASERRLLYGRVYDELFRSVPDHPQLTDKQSVSATNRNVQREMKLLRRFLRPGMSFLEVGPGDCSLAFSVARVVHQVFAIDVSAEVTRCSAVPANVTVILSDGTSIPVTAASVNLAFSDQLMEHLHPDDAKKQLENLYEALADGGKYICITPNRITGPHDISQYFDDIPTGFHLREYSMTECAALFREVGFRRVTCYVTARGLYPPLPLVLVIACEWLASAFPSTIRKSRLVRAMFRMIVVGHK
jgi:SAM-dependent methyltransferase